jgi:predicted nucleotide-binding protein
MRRLQNQTLCRPPWMPLSLKHSATTLWNIRYSGATMFSWPINLVQPTPIHKIQDSLQRCRARSLELLHQAASFLRQELELHAGVVEQDSRSVRRPARGANVVIGHGRSLVWRELKDFIEARLRLPVDEFNRVSVAGVPTIARLSEMLDGAAFAFLVMTGEDEQVDGKVRARENVIHEVGLFQGRLSFGRAIILLEEGCEEFSNIHGLGQIRFPKGNVSAKFEDVRAVLEREGMLL